MAKKKSRFEYKKRSREQVQRRSEQSGGAYDNYIQDEFRLFTPKNGNFQIRILPPTWDDADNYGADVWVHYGIGADKNTYACLAKMKGEDCPVCEERTKAENRDPDYAKELAPKRRVLIWIIDRDHEDDGPIVWAMPWTLDKDINKLAVDERSKEYLLVDDPEEGYDIKFSKEGENIHTKYIGVAINRRPSPISDDDDEFDDWLEFIEDNPLPEIVKYYPYEHINKVFSGGAVSGDDEDEEEEDEDEKPRRRSKYNRRSRDEDDEDEKPRRRSRKRVEEEDEEDDDPPWEEEEDEDDEEEEKPRRRSRKKVEEEEDEDEEEERPAKRSRRRSKRDDDDDEDEDDEDEVTDRLKNNVRRRRK
jgi:hypothetical protein